MIDYRRTKIVCTIGPASRSPEMLAALIKAGANVFRLNFSHGTADEHLETLKRIRATSQELGIPVAVLQDLCGPKIRISTLPETYATLTDGAAVELRAAGYDAPFSSKDVIFVESLDPAGILKPGQRALLADGMIELCAQEIVGNRVICKAVKGGRLRSRVGIAFPDSAISLPATTEKDLRDFQWGLEHEVDFVAVSFVREAADIVRLREKMGGRAHRPSLIAKIERREALENIDDILDQSDAIMVARGDLGVELPLEQIPHIQRDLITQANERGIPVIVATQMLASMVTSTRPTRAEATDVAFAVMSGADAVMLSEETAIGENPVRCVEYLSKIASEAERELFLGDEALDLRKADHNPIPDSIAFATCAAALKIEAQAIIACTSSGASARLVAKYRPEQPLFGVSMYDQTLRRMCLYWGVIPLSGSLQEGESECQTALRTVRKRYAFSAGSLAVLTLGQAVGTPGATNRLEIHEL